MSISLSSTKLNSATVIYEKTQYTELYIKFVRMSMIDREQGVG